jgi:hypothetical protein
LDDLAVVLLGFTPDPRLERLLLSFEGGLLGAAPV